MKIARWFLLSLLVILLARPFVSAEDVVRGSTFWFVRFIDNITGDERFEEHVEADTWFLTNLNSGLEMMRIEAGQSTVFIPQRNLVVGLDGNDSARLSTDASGSLTIKPRTSLIFNVGNRAYTWPSADGTSGQVLQTNGSGTLSWATSGGSPGGSDAQVQYNSSSSFGGSSGINLNATQVTGLTFSSGAIASSVLTTGLSDEQGSGSAVFATSPTLTTPTIGAATATSIAIGANTLNTSEWGNLDGVDQTLATTSSPSFVDLTLTGSGPQLNLQNTGGDTFGIHAEGSSAASSLLYIKNASSGAIGFLMGGDDTTYIGVQGSPVPSVRIITDGTGGDELSVPALSIDPFEMDVDVPTSDIVFVIDGGGSAITTGVKGDLQVDFDCIVQAWTVLLDQSGSITVDIWKDTYANYPPTAVDTMVGNGTKPSVSSATNNTSTTPNWTKLRITAGDTIRYNVDSITTATRATVSIKVRKI